MRLKIDKFLSKTTSIWLFYTISIFLIQISTINCINLPSFTQKSYIEAENLSVKTRKLASPKNLALDFYSLKFCKPKQTYNSAGNLGELLFGDNIQNSLYNVCQNFLFLQKSPKILKNCPKNLVPIPERCQLQEN